MRESSPSDICPGNKPLNCSSNLCSGADVTILARQMIDYVSNCSSQFSPDGKSKRAKRKDDVKLPAS